MIIPVREPGAKLKGSLDSLLQQAPVIGDPETTITYHPLTIADYEGAGLSAHGRDEAFMRDRADLNQRYLSLSKRK